jgi:hypothetical protein
VRDPLGSASFVLSCAAWKRFFCSVLRRLEALLLFCPDPAHLHVRQHFHACTPTYDTATQTRSPIHAHPPTLTHPNAPEAQPLTVQWLKLVKPNALKLTEHLRRKEDRAFQKRQV